MTAPLQSVPPADFSRQLINELGAGQVTTDSAMTAFATDVYRSREMPLALVRPRSVAELQATVRLCAAAGVAVFTRGGGASYTDGYLPSTRNSVLIDMGALNRIVEINAADCYVTVEAGVTWATLRSALEPLGLRTPFFGPFSGIAATVGGSVSQHSISHGSAAHGISAQSVISLDVVTASGALLSTGSAARGSAPFLRWYGPDLTGLFTGDCGTLGVKARITLPLLRRQPAFECASYGFERLEDMAAALRSAGLERLEDEHFAIDAALSRGQIARQQRSSKLALIRSLWASAPSVRAGISQLLRIALAGTRQLQAAAYSVHFILDGSHRREVRSKAARLETLMREHRGTSMVNTVPAVVRGMPFAPLINTLGPNGERWVPVHGHLPHSKVMDFHRALEELFASRAAQMQRLGVWRGGMYMSIGSTAFLYEVALYWPGAQTPYHAAQVPADYLAALPRFEHNEEAAVFVEQLKQDVIALYSRHGAVHFQLGKIYPYGSVLTPESLTAMRAVKQAFDPANLMNPGALQL